MFLFRYLIHSDDCKPFEKVYYASSETEAFRKLDTEFPDWVSVELVHTYKCHSAVCSSNRVV